MAEPKIPREPDFVKPIERETLKARIIGISGGYKKKKHRSIWETFVNLFFNWTEEAEQYNVSTTRPRTLPPKSREEEKQHLAEYEAIMRRYRQREEQEEQEKTKKRELQLRREQIIRINTQKWEFEILVDWENKKDLPETKALWWEGLPPRVRGVIWSKAVGNGLNLTMEKFKEYLKKAQKLKMIVNLEEATKKEQYIKQWNLRNSAKEKPSGFHSVPQPTKESSTPSEVPDPINDHPTNDTTPIASIPSHCALDTHLSQSAQSTEGSSIEAPQSPTSPSLSTAVVSQPIPLPMAVMEATSPQSFSPEIQEVNPELITQMLNEKLPELIGKEKTVSLITLDLPRTFPVLAFFQPGGPCHHQLRQVLEAYVCHRPELGYVQGMSFIAASLLLNMDEFEAWICLCNILNSPILTVFYNMDVDEIQVYLNTFIALMAELLPSLHKHLNTNLNIEPHTYFFDWVLTLFTKSIPIESAAHVFDLYVLEGEYFLFRAGLGMLSFLQPKLLAGDFDEAMHTLQQIATELIDDRELFKCIQAIDLTDDKYRSTLAKFNIK